jgi:hypothetical protein
VLSPAARRHWRGTTTLQLTLSPHQALLVEGLDEGRRAVLPLLDGGRTREQVLEQARRAGCSDPEDVLDVLEEAGLLLDADALQVPAQERADRHRLAPDLAALTLAHGGAAPGALRARARARVVVHGAGRVGAPLAALLTESGVGTVEVRDPARTRWEDTAVGGLRPEDVGRPREEALAERLPTPEPERRPDLVVLTDEVGEVLPRVLVRDGIPHLVARTHGLLGVVGPLVLPGASACLRCLELVRVAVDPDLPHLVPAGEPVEAQHGVLAAAVAAQAALQVLELLEQGAPATAGGTLELSVPGWRWRRRSWPAHPGCACGAASAALPAPA